MEKINIIVIRGNFIDIQGEDNIISIEKTELQTFNSFKNECINELNKRKPILPIPNESHVYTMIKPCPVDNDLKVNVYDINYSNDKENKVIKIDIRVIHTNSQGERVPQLDCDTFIIADMTEERRVQIVPDVYEYSYVLANTILQNGEPISTLIAMACQIADADGSLNKRIYNI